MIYKYTEFINEGVKHTLNRQGTFIVKERTNVVAVTKSVENFIKTLDVKYTKEKARTTNSTYFMFDVDDDIDVKIRVSDHSKAHRYLTDVNNIDHTRYHYYFGSNGFSFEYNIDGVNINTNTFKTKYYEDVKLAKFLIIIRDKVFNMYLAFKMEYKDEFKHDNDISKFINIDSCELLTEFINSIDYKINELPEVKVKKEKNKKEQEQEMINTCPLHGYKSNTYNCKNGCYDNTSASTDSSKWKAYLPSNIEQLVKGMNKEDSITLKNNLRADAIKEFKDFLTSKNKSFQ